jgi:hypothetical protein
MRPNVLPFSCEAANAIIECLQDAARLRLLQRRVRQLLAEQFEAFRAPSPGAWRINFPWTAPTGENHERNGEW